VHEKLFQVTRNQCSLSLLPGGEGLLHTVSELVTHSERMGEGAVLSCALQHPHGLKHVRVRSKRLERRQEYRLPGRPGIGWQLFQGRAQVEAIRHGAR